MEAQRREERNVATSPIKHTDPASGRARRDFDEQCRSRHQQERSGVSPAVSLKRMKRNPSTITGNIPELPPQTRDEAPALVQRKLRQSQHRTSRTPISIIQFRPPKSSLRAISAITKLPNKIISSEINRLNPFPPTPPTPPRLN